MSVLQQGGDPSIRLVTATERAKAGTESLESVAVVELAAAGPAVAGPRFGALLHAVLATIPLDGGTEAVKDAAQLQARIVGATAEETEAAVARISAALEHPLLQRARAAAATGECHRETPITLREDDGTLVEGVADLVFRENSRWVVLDFKTDQELATAVDQYRRQVALYAAAVATATGVASEGYLLRL